MGAFHFCQSRQGESRGEGRGEKGEGGEVKQKSATCRPIIENEGFVRIPSFSSNDATNDAIERGDLIMGIERGGVVRSGDSC